MKEMQAVKGRGRNDPCWCGSGKKLKKCHINEAPAAPSSSKNKWFSQVPPNRPVNANLIKSPEQIAAIRTAGRLNAEILDLLVERIKPGVTTEQIDQFVYDHTIAQGAIPATLNYKGYTKSCCTSVNEVVCHGIPGERVLNDGDIINVDVTSVLDGVFADSSRMFLVGNVSEEARKLVAVTEECLEAGIAAVKPGNFIGDIGFAIQHHAEKQGYSVVRDFVGHGTGLKFHEEPQVPHFGRKGHGHPLMPGMVFTIEPMINQGVWQVKVLEDGWTAVTRDGKLSAQFEHTVTVTDAGVKILTA